jgi:hypothetical protein
VGSGAWGIAYVDTVLELPDPEAEERVRHEALRMYAAESETS